MLVQLPRLLLRHWEESDLDAFFGICSRDDVMRWLGPHPRRALTTTDEARERLARWSAGSRKLEPPLGMWATVPLSPAEQPPAGTLLLMPFTDADGPAGRKSAGTCIRAARAAGSPPKRPRRCSPRRPEPESARCSPR
jgi:RimJ/RimL family protein N-acetyltransferase